MILKECNLISFYHNPLAMTKRHLNDLKKLLQSNFIKYWGLKLQKSDQLRTYRESNQYSCLKNILNMFQIPLIVAIWLVLEQVVINYALSMVDRLSQRLLLQKDFVHNAH